METATDLQHGYELAIEQTVHTSTSTLQPSISEPHFPTFDNQYQNILKQAQQHHRNPRPKSKSKRRRRPHSAGRTRSKSREQLWSQGALHSTTHTSSKKRNRKQRPQSAGKIRSIERDFLLDQMLNHSSSAPEFKSHPFLNKSFNKRFVSRKNIRKNKIKKLESSWNNEFAQNLKKNQNILGNQEDSNESRRREYMNHNHDQFTALNQLRHAILNKRKQEDNKMNRKKKKLQIIQVKRTKKMKMKNHKKNRNRNRLVDFDEDGSNNKNTLTMSGKTRMKTRRITTPLDKRNALLQSTKSSTTSSSSKKKTLQEIKFVKKCTQIRSLFEDLKLPQRDRRFFTKNFMSRYDDRNNNFVNEQLDLLHLHRDHTLNVLACIRRRETSVKQLHAVTKACISALLSSKNNGQESQESPVSPSQQDRFRSILIDAARRAQETSCDVIDAIVPWRKDFWRPHPFKWKSKNYLLRMGNCVGLQKFVIDQDYVNALKMCRLPKGCFDVLLPEKICQELCTDGGEIESNAGDDDDETNGKNGNRSSVALERIRNAQKIIQKEVQLVEELAKELDKLLDQGFFIPRLRWNPNSLTNKKVEKKEEEYEAEYEDDF